MDDATTLPVRVGLAVAPALIAAAAAYLLAGRAVKDALRKLQVERAFDRKREWYEETMRTVSECHYKVSLCWQGCLVIGPAINSWVEAYNYAALSAAAVTRLTLGARLYAAPDTITALEALHTDTATVMTGLLRISAGQKRAAALLHLRRRLLHTGDVLTA